MIRVAFYGKGGIGKSAITANLAAELGRRGLHVLYIGCDPKADSVRKLTGKRIPTVLDQINELGENLKRQDILFPGEFGVCCMEAGGPQAGAGCAGMGLKAMAAELERLGILEEGWDVVLYDVLGDVVCGGFSIPMRRQFADRIYIVTSSDYMSLYAANNVLKGVLRYDEPDRLLMGRLIQNHVKGDWDMRMVSLFSQMTHTCCLGAVPESGEFLTADYREETVLRACPQGEMAAVFQALAGRLLDVEQSLKAELPRALSDEEMDRLRYCWLEEKGGLCGG